MEFTLVFFLTEAELCAWAVGRAERQIASNNKSCVWQAWLALSATFHS